MIRAAEGITGRPVTVEPSTQANGLAHASWAASDSDPGYDRILYRPESAKHLDHLVAHELGHVLLYHDAPPEKRLLAVIGAQQRANAERVIRPAIPSFLGFDNLPLPEQRSILGLWTEGVASQCMNFPQDVLIESRLYDDHPSHRSRQREYLATLASEAHSALTDRILILTPEPVAVAANAMNYALLKRASSFLREPWMLRPFKGTTFERVGEQLDAQLISRSPENLADCISTSNAWAGTLGIGSWFNWRPAPHR